MKKTFLLLTFLLLLFLLTPLSLHQINKKIEEFLHLKSQTLVENFQKQIGLKIHWEKLNFKLLSMSINLENVTLENTNLSTSKKNNFFIILNGAQTVKSINIRPSLLSLMLKKTIMLSKVKMDYGTLNIQTNNNIQKTYKTRPADFNLPIKRIIIKNTNLTLTHKDNTLRLMDIDWDIQRKSSQGYYFTNSIKKVFVNQENSFFLKSKGLIEKNRIYVEKMTLSNDTLNVKTSFLEILLNSRGLKNLKLKSSGKIPFSSINQILKILGKTDINITSLISYDLNIQFNKKKGYKGQFQIQSSDFIFKNKPYKSFSAKGRLLNKTALIDQGFIKIDSLSFINFDKVEILFNSLPIQYNLSLQVRNLKASSFLKDTIDIRLPVIADINGTVKCIGNIDLYVDCKIKSQSPQIDITNWKERIISFYKMDTDLSIEWKNKILNFEITAKKEDSSLLQIIGKYKPSSNLLTIIGDGFAELNRDIAFNTPLDLKGSIKLENSLFKLNKGIFTAKGYLNSDLLEIEKYKLKTITSQFNFKNQKIIFKNIKSIPGKSHFQGYCSIDFNKKESIVKGTFSFIDIQDIKQAIEANIKWPLDIKGTGTAAFFIKKPWNSKKNLSFDLSGNFFNTHIQKEIFQRVDFDISSKEGQGLLKNLSLTKGSGLITASGDFNKNFNLTVKGTNLSIESSNLLTSFLPFKQSGFLNFNMKILGALKNPKGVGEFSVSDAFLYTFSVEDTKAKISINKKGLTLSGNIINKFLIKKFYYPFSKQEPIFIHGDFFNFDLIKILRAKNQKETTENYYSRLKGNINLFISQTKSRFWKGHLHIKDFFLFKEKKWLKSKKPFSISFSKEAWLLDPVSFSQYNRKKFRIQKKDNQLLLSGDTSLSFISILFPALNNLDGNIQTHLITSRNLKQWNPQGTVKIKNGTISIDTLPDFSNINSSLQINNTKIKISKFKSSIGLGSSSGSGYILYNFINPPTVDLFFNFSNIHLNLPKDFSTEGDGFVKITGNRYPYLLNGHYMINSGTITKNFSNTKMNIANYYSLTGQKKSKKFSPFQLQFKIETKQPLSINNSVLNSSIEGSSSIFGTLQSPSLTGDFNISTAREDNLILFRDQEFKIISGSVGFKNSPPDNPFINIKSQTLFKAKSIDTLENNQETLTEYKIFLTVNGLAKNLNFSLESSPSIDEKEIISMLTLGVNSKYFDANVKENVTDYSYHLLGSFLLNQSLNKELKNKLGLGLNISSQINVLNEPVTKIALKKVWFDKLRTSFSRTIEEFPTSDIRLKYDLKPSISLTTFWENIEHIKIDSSEKQKMGLDFEFSFDF